MIPPLIVEEALRHGIHLIAITDHNGTANIAAVQRAAQDTGLSILPGMELQTREEVHCLCLFDSLDQALALQDWVDARLPGIANNAEFFGEQFIVDETGDFIRREERLLLNSVDADLNDAWAKVNELGGLFIPAHINRPAFGLMAVLGLLPVDIRIEALEISRHLTPEEVFARYPEVEGYPILQNGDVHYLDDFLGATYLQVDNPSITEIRLALQSQDERKFFIDNPHSIK
jgi:3',5'-nucleoside bisphosphate phosphatase